MAATTGLRRKYEEARKRGVGIEPGFGTDRKPPRLDPVGRIKRGVESVKRTLDPERESRQRIAKLKPKIEEKKAQVAGARILKKYKGR